MTVQDANAGDTTTMVETLITAAEQVEAVLPAGDGLAEVVGDKDYHSNADPGRIGGAGAAQLRIGAGPRATPVAAGRLRPRAAAYANRRRIRRGPWAAPAPPAR